MTSPPGCTGYSHDDYMTSPPGFVSMVAMTSAPGPWPLAQPTVAPPSEADGLGGHPCALAARRFGGAAEG